MQHTPELKILFATNFSDSCFQTGRSIAQLADTCHVSLTIAHVAGIGGATPQKHRELNSFLAEADHFDHCRRLLIETEDPASSIARLCREEHFDLVLAPASDRFGLKRLFTTSSRAQILRYCPAPLWTFGAALDMRGMKQTIRTVACVADLNRPDERFLGLASAFASRYGAYFQVLHVIPPVEENTLAHTISSNAPLMPEVARERIRSLFAGNVFPEVDVAIGEPGRELPRMLRKCDADVVFIGPGQALNGMFQRKLAGYLDRLPCPAICVDGASAKFHRWSFQDVPRFSTHHPVAAPAGEREVVTVSAPLPEAHEESLPAGYPKSKPAMA